MIKTLTLILALSASIAAQKPAAQTTRPRPADAPVVTAEKTSAHNLVLKVSLLALSPMQAAPDLISSDISFTDGATVRLQPDPACVKIYETGETFRTEQEKQKLKACAPSKIETGNLRGIVYRFYYSDGSGSFVGKPGNILDVGGTYEDNWNVGCRKDAITDKKSCHMQLHDFWIFIGSDLKPLISIGTDHYPGSAVAIRVDREPPSTVSTGTLKGSFLPQDSARIIDRISKAKTITTRYHKWPRDYPIDSTWDVYGFSEALQYIKWAVSHIR